jgi:serine/threonine protein kinase
VARLVAGRYELGRQLGSGAVGEVVEAFDQRLGRQVAIKLLKTDIADPAARERFEREALMAARLVDPHVVTIYDVGEDQGRPFLVMELVDGTTLAQQARSEHRRPATSPSRCSMASPPRTTRS